MKLQVAIEIEETNELDLLFSMSTLQDVIRVNILKNIAENENEDKLIHDDCNTAVKKLIHESRINFKTMKNQIDNLDSDNAKEIFMMQQFLINCLPKSKRLIASQCFFKDIKRVIEKNEGSLRTQQICVYVLPLYLLGIFIYVLVVSVLAGSESTNIWLYAIFLGILLVVFILHPFFLWLQYLIYRNVMQDLKLLFVTLNHNKDDIFKRKFSLSMDALPLIHHFNPACRLALKYPQLLSSRLIMLINDNDLDINFINQESLASKYRKHKVFKWEYFILSISQIFSVAFFLEHCHIVLLNDSVIEFAIYSLFHLFIIATAFLSVESYVGPIVVFIVVIAIILCYEYSKIKKRDRGIVVPMNILEDKEDENPIRILIHNKSIAALDLGPIEKKDIKRNSIVVVKDEPQSLHIRKYSISIVFSS